METSCVLGKTARYRMLTASSEAELMETWLLARANEFDFDFLTASSEAELMETGGAVLHCLEDVKPHRFFGSGINGNETH